MKNTAAPFLFAAVTLFAASAAQGTGMATCDSGAKESWQPAEKLEKTLTGQGWKIRRIKVDGGCYEVYAINEKGDKVEAYFHPQTLAPVPTKPRK